MESRLGWVDFSSEHRDRVRAAIDILSRPGVVDELGIGMIRDAFSDYLFPGISTIQTRPKYFLIVPRILKDYEELSDKKRSRTKLSEYLAEQELACRVKLVEQYGNQEALGIIGVSFGTRTNVDVQRRPSSVYWRGLQAFGIIRTRLSLAEYCRRYGGHRPSLSLLLQESRDEHGDDVDADDLALSPIASLPEDMDWQENLSITLRASEAEFLRQRICAKQPNSLLGQILLDEKITDAFVDLTDQAAFGDLVELLEAMNFSDERLLRVAGLAWNIWCLLYGAHVRYNVLLQRRYGTRRRALEHEASWQEWMDSGREVNWNAADTDDLWQLVSDHGSKLPKWTYRFVNGWIEATVKGEADLSVYDELVVQQEIANKTKRARLRGGNRDEAVGEWVGIRNLSFRLPQAWRLVADIRQAETGEEDA